MFRKIQQIENTTNRLQKEPNKYIKQKTTDKLQLQRRKQIAKVSAENIVKQQYTETSCKPMLQKD